VRGHQGVPGLASGDHVCGFYFGPEERDLLLRVILRAGRRAGAWCACVVDDDPDLVAARVRAELGAELVGDGGWFSLRGIADEDRDATGFPEERMVEYLDAVAADAVGHDVSWVAGEMSHALRRPDLVPQLLAHELEADAVIHGRAQAVVCLYDLELVGAGLLTELLRTHPKLLLGDVLVDNPAYAP
jgi:MEDS: MEthanogen/methylotroph, DcmR Sensory domain